MTYIDNLREVIQNLHGVRATHLESVPVTELWQGRTVWDGVVEVFTLHDHPTANIAYAWSHDTNDPENPRQHVTVLKIPPVESPVTAVRAAILQEFRDAGTA
jgi:hypothetical protein